MSAAGQLGVLDPELERTSNRVELVGYVGRRPELRYTTELEPMLTLSLATHRWREDGGQPRQVTDWHRVVAYGALAREHEGLRTGELVRAIGRLQTHTWTDRYGNRQVRTEVVLEELQRGPRRAWQVRLPLSQFT
jgi:single-strand DNA-binding protein